MGIIRTSTTRINLVIWNSMNDLFQSAIILIYGQVMTMFMLYLDCLLF